MLFFSAGLLLTACQGQPNQLAPPENVSIQEQAADNFNQQESETDLENLDLGQGVEGRTDDVNTIAGEEMGNDETEGEFYSYSEVAAHATATDCWLVIEGQVYDVTPFIESQSHPGGAAILEGCGTDATSIFNQRPKDGEPHSDIARSFLPKYQIGTLATE